MKKAVFLFFIALAGQASSAFAASVVPDGLFDYRAVLSSDIFTKDEMELLYSSGAVTSDEIAREFLWTQLLAMPSEKRPKVGLVLSGGGARGFAHVGVLDVLRVNGFPVDMIAGTSMGAVVGSMYAAGMPIKTLWQIGNKATLDIASDDMNTFGIIRLLTTETLFSSQRMGAFLNEKIGEKNFSDLKIPFACVAMDIKTGERVVFTDGDVGLAVRASMNLPGVFKPVEYRHRYLVDGGVADNAPVDVARDMGADWVFTSLIRTNYTRTSFGSIYSYLMQALDIRGHMLVDESLKNSNFILVPQLGEVGFLDFSKATRAGQLGLEEAFRNIDAAKDSLMLFSMGPILNDYTRK
ncbi:MAG: patatin-like phospholipase family protein [Elusimicrobiaceae bacterium]|jgi:NTE family protein